MKNDSISKKFIPEQDVEIGLDEGYRPFEDDEVEAFSSLLEYASNILNDSSFEIAAAIESYRGQTLIYENEGSVIAVSDDDGLGIDYFDFKGEADVEGVMEHLDDTGYSTVPGLRNDLHKNLSGDEAYDEIHKLLQVERQN